MLFPSRGLTMNSRIEANSRPPGDARLGFLLIAAAVACLIAIGGVLWWRQGGAVFNDMVLSALAWCF
jgi:hypothetical protein